MSPSHGCSSCILGRMSVSWARIPLLRRDAAIPLTIFGCMGIVTAVFLSVAAARQEFVWSRGAEPTIEGPLTSPRYFGVVPNWDGQWYKSIAENGYPVPLPVSNGNVAQNEWAFYPLYPALVRMVMFTTTLGYDVSAWLVSVSCTAAAVVLVYRMTLRRMGRFGAGALVACVCAYAAAPLLQVGYAESLTLLLVVAALWALRERRYGLLLIIALLLALTRPLLLPLAGVVAIHWWHRHRAAKRGVELFDTRSRVGVALVVVSVIALFGLWPAIAALATGTPNAYLVTLAAWPVNLTAGGVLGGWFGEILGMTSLGWLAILCVVVLAYLVARRGSAVWGVELRSWAFLYPLYLIAATRPSPSVLRYFLLSIAPLWPMPDPPQDETTSQRRTRWAFLILLVTIGLVAQFFWATQVFVVTGEPQFIP